MFVSHKVGSISLDSLLAILQLNRQVLTCPPSVWLFQVRDRERQRKESTLASRRCCVAFASCISVVREDIYIYNIGYPKTIVCFFITTFTSISLVPVPRWIKIKHYFAFSNRFRFGLFVFGLDVVSHLPWEFFLLRGPLHSVSRYSLN